MADQIKNCYLINAPAGSGKTTQIKSMIRKITIEKPKDNILCITYTNRAADELSKDIGATNIFIGTIHSFLYEFMKRYFKMLRYQFDIGYTIFLCASDYISAKKYGFDSLQYKTGTDRLINFYKKFGYQIIKDNIMVWR